MENTSGGSASVKLVQPFLMAPTSVSLSAWYKGHCQGDASAISKVFLSPFPNTQLYFQNLILDRVGEEVGGVYFWQSDVSISHIWLIRNLARNSSLYSFGNRGPDHKSPNQALIHILNFKLSFCLPSVLPEEHSNRRANTECSMVSSHWDGPQACGEVTFPWHHPRQQSGVRQKLWAWSHTPFSLLSCQCKPYKPWKHLWFSNSRDSSNGCQSGRSHGVGGSAAIAVQEGACPWCVCVNREEWSMAELAGVLGEGNQ